MRDLIRAQSIIMIIVQNQYWNHALSFARVFFHYKANQYVVSEDYYKLLSMFKESIMFEIKHNKANM